ncbi:MAG: hypothetical protein K5662_06690 [Lachnospiraceae bacterium]|nr:hypothetical protein [Lachnospiraceae bacterium]
MKIGFGLYCEDKDRITTTPAHPFYVKDIGFVKVADLVEGATFVDEEGPKYISDLINRSIERGLVLK